MLAGELTLVYAVIIVEKCSSFLIIRVDSAASQFIFIMICLVRLLSLMRLLSYLMTD
jgi:hypothetical protein